jgi:hypothetical protein
MAVQKAFPGEPVKAVLDDTTLDREAAAAAGKLLLLLVNRVLEPGFDTESGVELIPLLRKKYPAARLLLVSNYPDAQAQAVAAGALPGFGKKDIGTPALTVLLQEAAK